jgi:hypothetical protein
LIDLQTQFQEIDHKTKTDIIRAAFVKPADLNPNRITMKVLAGQPAWVEPKDLNPNDLRPEKYMRVEDPSQGIYSYWDVSTGHLTEHDDYLLMKAAKGAGSEDLVTYITEQGYWVFVTSDEEEINRLHQEGFSPAFINLMHFARERGIWWIKLDAEGMVHSGFATHDW